MRSCVADLMSRAAVSTKQGRSKSSDLAGFAKDARHVRSGTKRRKRANRRSWRGGGKHSTLESRRWIMVRRYLGGDDPEVPGRWRKREGDLPVRKPDQPWIGPTVGPSGRLGDHHSSIPGACPRGCHATSTNHASDAMYTALSTGSSTACSTSLAQEHTVYGLAD